MPRKKKTEATEAMAQADSVLEVFSAWLQSRGAPVRLGAGCDTTRDFAGEFCRKTGSTLDADNQADITAFLDYLYAMPRRITVGINREDVDLLGMYDNYLNPLPEAELPPRREAPRAQQAPPVPDWPRKEALPLADDSEAAEPEPVAVEDE